MAIPLGGIRYRDQATSEKGSSSESLIVTWTSTSAVRTAGGGSATSGTMAANAPDATFRGTFDFSTLPANAVIESITFGMRASASRVLSAVPLAGLGVGVYTSGGSIMDLASMADTNTANVLEDWAGGGISMPRTRADLLTAYFDVTATADDTLNISFNLDYVYLIVVYNY